MLHPQFLVYVAAPFSPTAEQKARMSAVNPLVYNATHAVNENKASAALLGLDVARLGCMPIVPHTATGGRPELEQLQDYDFWIKGTAALLRRCDAALFSLNWEESSGAKSEARQVRRVGYSDLLHAASVARVARRNRDRGRGGFACIAHAHRGCVGRRATYTIPFDERVALSVQVSNDRCDFWKARRAARAVVAPYRRIRQRRRRTRSVMHERDARPNDEGVHIPGKTVLPALRHGINRKLRRQLASLAGKEDAQARLERVTGLNSNVCAALLKRTVPSVRGK